MLEELYNCMKKINFDPEITTYTKINLKDITFLFQVKFKS